MQYFQSCFDEPKRSTRFFQRFLEILTSLSENLGVQIKYLRSLKMSLRSLKVKPWKKTWRVCVCSENDLYKRTTTKGTFAISAVTRWYFDSGIVSLFQKPIKVAVFYLPHHTTVLLFGACSTASVFFLMSNFTVFRLSLEWFTNEQRLRLLFGGKQSMRFVSS